MPLIQFCPNFERSVNKWSLSEDHLNFIWTYHPLMLQLLVCEAWTILLCLSMIRKAKTIMYRQSSLKNHNWDWQLHCSVIQSLSKTSSDHKFYCWLSHWLCFLAVGYERTNVTVGCCDGRLRVANHPKLITCPWGHCNVHKCENC